MAWYNTYRPQSFKEVIGQTTVIDVLQKSLQKGVVKHAYLFSGSKGIGKTTIARIFAVELAQAQAKPENSIDIIELDAASHTGIDDIRILIESSTTPPISAPYKVFIIDEVHMLSKPAMNALLKTLEEPPRYLVFLLATTNPEKLLATVLSRLTHFKLYTHTQAQLVSRLQYIAEKEGVNITIEALDIIAKRSNGSQRDAINDLETVASYQLSEYTPQTIAPILGIADEGIIKRLVDDFAENQSVSHMLLQEVAQIGIDGITLLNHMLEFCLDQQLQGNTRYQTVIDPLFDSLNTRFPLVSAASCLALVQSRFKSLQVAGPAVTQSVNNTSTLHAIQAIQNRVQEQNIAYSYTPQQEKTIAPDTIELAIQPNSESKLSNTHVTTNDIQDYVLQLMNDPESNAVVKMILPDLRIESLQSNMLQATTSNGLFLARLNNNTFKNWFAQKLNERFGLTFECEFSTRMYHASSQSIYDIADSLESKAEEDTEAFHTINKLDEDAPQTEDPAKPYFYSVYKNLPTEIQNSNIPVKTNPIQEPVSSVDSKDEWSQSVDDMFDFE